MGAHGGRCSARQEEAVSKVVLCHGCFDVLHIGHIKHLQEAKSHGDYLVVSITAAEFVNKGVGFPIFSDSERRDQLLAQRVVDQVYVCRAAWAAPAIYEFRPVVYCKGVDYYPDRGVPDVDRKACTIVGAQVIYTRSEKVGSRELTRRLRCAAW